MELPSGQIIADYHVLEFEKQAVGALIENENGKLLLIESYRYPTDSIEWEISGGSIDQVSQL